MRKEPAFIRKAVKERDKGKCANCGIPTVLYYNELLRCETYSDFIEKLGKLSSTNSTWYKKILRKLEDKEKWLEAFGDRNLGTFIKEGYFWEAAHEVDIQYGGGLCGLEGYKTLCVPCHELETNRHRRKKSDKTIGKTREQLRAEVDEVFVNNFREYLATIGLSYEEAMEICDKEKIDMHSQIETESETDDEIESDDKAETDDEIENNDNKIENNPSQQKKVLCNKLMRYGVRSLSEFSPLLGLKITKELVKPEHVYEIRESAHTRKVSQLTNVYSSSRNRSVSSSGIEFEAPLNYKSDNDDKRAKDDIVSVEELLEERPDNLINRANKGINYKNNTLTNLGIRSKSINKSLKSDIGRSSTKKRKWTQSEDDALRHGYRQFGRNWAKIKQKYGTELVNRTNVNIKDRFRILSKTETF